MSQNPHFCDSVRGPEATPKPLQATPKLYNRHILGIDSGVQSHPKATPRLHQSHPKAPPRLHQGHTKATPKPPQSHPQATPKLLLSYLVRAFQGLEGAKTARFAGSLGQLRPGRNMTLSPRLALRTWPERGCPQPQHVPCVGNVVAVGGSRAPAAISRSAPIPDLL
jgi:hypothetical protein